MNASEVFRARTVVAGSYDSTAVDARTDDVVACAWRWNIIVIATGVLHTMACKYSGVIFGVGLCRQVCEAMAWDQYKSRCA